MSVTDNKQQLGNKTQAAQTVSQPAHKKSKFVSTLTFTGRMLRGTWRLAATQATTDGKRKFSGSRLMVSTVLGAAAGMAVYTGYTYGTDDVYNNVIVTARDAEPNGSFEISGKIFTKDKKGELELDKRFFSIHRNMVRLELLFPNQVYKDIPNDSICNFKTYGLYYYSLVTGSVPLKPTIYSADCHSMTYEEKLAAANLQTKAGDNVSRMEKFMWGAFKYSVALDGKPVRSSADAALRPTQAPQVPAPTPDLSPK